jgi:asparagine synthase (glutamine-hydrolysing)
MNDHKRHIYVLDMPIAGYSAPYRTLSRHVRKTSKTILTGHGGDELFCGYPKYITASLALSFNNAFNGKNANFDFQSLPYLKFFEQQAKNVFSQCLFKGEREVIRAVFDRSYFLWDDINPELKNTHYDPLDDAMAMLKNRNGETDLQKILYIDRKTLLPSLLHVEDRTSMVENLESRTPLLDQKLLNFASKIPDNFLMRGSLKSLVRNAAKGIIPEAVYNNSRKSGIMYPIHDIFEKEMKSKVFETIYSLDKHKLFSKPLKEYFRTKEFNSSRTIWALWSLASWFENFEVKL